MTAKEAFELGFLQRCSEENLTPEQVSMRVKFASLLIKTSDMHDIAQAVGKMVYDPKADKYNLPAIAGLGAAGVGGTIAGGAGLGWLARKLQGDNLTAADVQKQELINQMNALSAKSHHSDSKALGL